MYYKLISDVNTHTRTYSRVSYINNDHEREVAVNILQGEWVDEIRKEKEKTLNFKEPFN